MKLTMMSRLVSFINEWLFWTAQYHFITVKRIPCIISIGMTSTICFIS